MTPDYMQTVAKGYVRRKAEEVKAFLTDTEIQILVNNLMHRFSNTTDTLDECKRWLDDAILAKT